MSRDALVVGINNYTYDGLHNLEAPARDAEAIASLLAKHGDFNVWRLPEAINKEDNSLYVGKKGKVTLKQLKKELIKLFKPDGHNIPDTALFYFSGHGLRETEGIPEGFLATSDVNPDLEVYGLSLQWLRRLLQESPIKQQIVWLDCCHSGELLNFTEANPGETGQVRDRCFIAASREFEQAWEDLGDSYSVLTKILLKGLNPNRCKNRWVDNYGLVDYLNQNINNATQRPIFTNFGQPINLTRTWEVTEEKVTVTVENAICPYKGLRYFDCNDEDPKYFHGREELTDQLIDKVRTSNFVAILGASGSGKSSVLRAGLLHQLKLGRKLAGSENWQYLIMLPGDRPLQNLAQAFIDPTLTQPDKAEQLGKAEGLLKEGADGLRRLIQSSDTPKTLLVIDQFEEVFTLCSDFNEREEFFKCILGAIEQLPDKLCIVLTMRADFFGKCVEQKYNGLANKIQEHLISVTPMEQEQLRNVIARPAAQVNLAVEDELIEQILEDVEGSPGGLPLLEYTLTELWKQRTNNTLKLATYIKLERIGGTLDQRATEVYNRLDPDEQETAKHIFLSLTQLGEGTEDTRKRIFKQDLITTKHSSVLIDKIVHKLADEKLIVTSEQLEKRSANARVAVVDVAHEALIRHWELLKQWLNENQEKLLQQRKIENNAQYWHKEGRKNKDLLRGSRWKEAKKFLQKHKNNFDLNEITQQFIKASKSEQKNV